MLLRCSSGTKKDTFESVEEGFLLYDFEWLGVRVLVNADNLPIETVAYHSISNSNEST